MSEQEVQDSQKTVVAFIAGLLVGGLLVWIFSTPNTAEMPADTMDETDSEVSMDSDEMSDDMDSVEMSEDTTDTAAETPVETTPELVTGAGSADVQDTTAGSVVTLDGAVFPTDEGWIAVRTYTEGQLGSILGASRYSKEQGLVPEAIELLAPTRAGRDYAIVFFSEDGNRNFNLDGDTQLDVEPSVFTAQ